MPTLVSIVLLEAERLRQVSEEGYSPDHDDSYRNGELLAAARCYLTAAKRQVKGWSRAYVEHAGADWPWVRDPFKVDPYAVRNLVKAGALIAAEIDRLLRAEIAEAYADSQAVVSGLPGASDLSLLPLNELHIACEVEGHSCAEILTHEEATVAHRGVLA